MTTGKKQSGLHPRNVHVGRYDFQLLCGSKPELRKHLRPNPAGDQTIDFGDQAAVLCLNAALLSHYYQIETWKIPPGYLCPPIPGRADYIHHLGDLLAKTHRGGVPEGEGVRVLDVGTGANCIYPIIGNRSHGWEFVGSEIDPVSLDSARAIVRGNPCLGGAVTIVPQEDAESLFRGVIGQDDRFSLTMCNPPFHKSAEQAQASNSRKVRNLAKQKSAIKPAPLNFGGQANELWCPGGEERFVKTMIRESVEFAEQVGWFTSLVSKAAHVSGLRRAATRAGAAQVEVVEMSQGQKRSRFLAWRFGDK